ncbi:amino acid adenylation domain-containing protein [Hymenobacter sp. B81]|uniref:amino acid adenylation domain-containing protein n=1 Tax=Hymenobacter sp. B81 TaxID=3344878 RepID=UPI0037DC63E8
MSEKENIQQIYPLTSMQEGMLFHTLRDASNAYFSQTTYTARGELRADLLERSLDELARRHDMLRTSFVYEKVEQPLQVVLRNRRIALHVEDISHLSEAEAAAYLADFRRRDVARGFDLTRDPLIRLSVLRTAERRHEFVWSYHHMLMDGWCLSTLLTELREIYRAAQAGRPAQLPPAQPFSRYIKWLGQQDKPAAAAYWQQYLRGYETLAAIPPDREAQPGVPFTAPEVASLTLGAEQTRQLEAWARRQHTTLNTVFQAVWGILLARYTNVTDVVYGNVVSGRPADLPGADQMIGLFINTVPLRVRFTAATRFAELVRQLHHDAVEAVTHHHHPLVDIQAGTELKSQLIQHVVAFENYPVQDDLLEAPEGDDPFSLGNVGGFEQTSYQLDVDVEIGRELTVTLYFNPQHYSPAYIQRLTRHLNQLLEQVLANPEAVISELELITPQERAEQLAGLNRGAVALGNDQPINLRFEQQAARWPAAPAVLHRDTTWSYAQLNEAANRIGHQLGALGVAAGAFVGVHLERGPELVAALLGILKLGAHYVPLDVQNPVSRTRELMTGSQMQGVVTDAAGLRALLAADPAENEAAWPRVLSVDALPAAVREQAAARGLRCADATELCQAATHNLPNQNQLDSWAYMLYTSGSTGQPKGAITRHDGAMNHLLAEIDELQLPVGFRFLQSASISSDVSVWQILGPILHGGATVIIDKDDLLDYAAVLRIMARQQVTIAEFVPSYLLGLAEYVEGLSAPANPLPALQWMMMVGEEVPVPLVNQWLALLPGCRVVNGYGPCEASDDIAQFLIDAPLPAAFRKVPIGRPLANMNIFVVDRHGKLLPTGLPGELVVSGVGVGAGYWQEPEKTAASFLPNPFEGTLGDTLYRTGDLARWRPDGLLEFLGRIDSQVKIRGYRVELGEIENRLRACPAVHDAAVVIRPYQGERQPIAYLVPRQPEALHDEATRQELRRTVQSFVQQHLAAYMHPAEYVLLAAFPLNLSDKVDRKALPEPGAAPRRARLAPANDTEARLLTLWQKVLERESIGTDENFFEIGGHSLKATRLAAQINKAFDAGISVRTIFAAPTIQQLSRQLAAGTSRYQPIPPAPAQPSYPLSHAQQRLWLVNQLDQDQYSYNMTAVYAIDGVLNPAALDHALRQLVGRHEILRTVFLTEAGEPRQRVLPADSARGLRYDDWRGRGLDQGAALAQAQQDFKTVFDLARGPLLRTRLIQLADQQFVLVLVLHHLVADGWSADILIGDLFAYYRAAQHSVAAELAPLALQYKDFAVWHNQELSGARAEQLRAYWTSQFADAVPVLELPTDFARPARRSQRGAALEIEIDAATTAGLKQLSARRGATLFMGLLASVKALLYRYTGQQDLVVGTVVSGRDHSDLEEQIGFYVNTLALRTRFDAAASFEQLLDQVKDNTLAAFEHQAYPFDQLVDDLSIGRELSRSPLFDVLVVLQNNGGGDDAFAGLPELRIAGADVAQEYSKFDLTVEAWENAAGTLTVALEYSTDLFTPARIGRMAGHYTQLLRAIVADAQTAVAALDYLPAAEQTELLALAGEAGAVLAVDTIPALFEQVAAQHAAATAAVDENRALSYQQLNAEANQLADCLRRRYRVGAEDIVVVAMTRRVEFVTVILAALKAGGAYLPLEAATPAGRVAELLAETGARVLITDQPDLLEILGNTQPCLGIDDLDLSQFSAENQPNPGLNASSLAYLMYTSGSTGKPKGVMIEHQGVVRLVRDTDYTGYGPGQRLLQTGSLAFDAATFEIWGPLLNGGQVHLLSLTHLLDTQRLRAIIQEHGITQAFFTTSWFNQLADEAPGLFAGLQRVLTGGEKMSVGHVRRVQQHCPGLEVVNLYGPTENTALSTYCLVPAPAPEHIPLGRPIARSTAYVVDGRGRLVPPGVAGELWLGGPGLARGYWQDEARTARQFVANPFGQGRLYRSGDVARWREDGQLEFLGRLDDQVKIRGFRVEPDGIAGVLRSFEGVADAAVLVHADAAGDKLLAGYYVATQAVTPAALKAYLQEQLPAYMVPALLLPLPALPLNRNGKLDKQALPDIQPLLSQAAAGRQQPTTATEAQLLAIWESVLGRGGLGTTDNFFEVGGNSLKAVRILARIQTELHRNLGLAAFFQGPTVQQLAAAIDQQPAAPLAGIAPAAPAARYEVSRAQKRLWIMDQLEAERAAYNICGAYVPAEELTAPLLSEALRRLLARHEILRTCFVEDGGQPYQHISPAEGLALPLTVTELSADEDFAEAVQLALDQEQTHEFALDQLPLLRLCLIAAPGQQALVLNLHHIIGDGWSLQLLLDELAAHYRAAQGRADALPALPIQYKDYAAWHNEQLASPAFEAHRQYWVQKLGAPDARPELPLDRPRAALRSYACEVLLFELSAPQAEALRRLCRAHDASLFTGLQALVKAWLNQYLRNGDVTVGTTTAGRDQPELAGQIGCYVNVLALRTRFAAGASFRELLTTVREDTLEAFEHQAYPFDLLIEKLNVRRDLSRNLLFDVMLTYLDGFEGDDPADGLGWRDWRPDGQESTNKYDLTLAFQSRPGGGIAGELTYATDLLLPATAAALQTALLDLLDQVLEQPDQPLNQLPTAALSEAVSLEDDFN